MSRALWFITGIGLGFVAAHQFNKTEQGKKFFSDVEGKAKEFGSAVAKGYREREAELRQAVADAEEAISDLTKKIKD